jgi:heme-degrading monooxygenase HmoA
MEYYTEKVLRYRVFTHWKDEKDTSNWSLCYSTNDMAHAEDMASIVNNNEGNYKIAKVVDGGKETSIKRMAW